MAILNRLQIRNLYTRYINVVNFINNQNNGYKNGQRIKQVQIPSSLTQSLAYHYISSNPSNIGLNNISVNNLKEGNNRTYDLIYHSIPPINIEIKATGTSVFQRFRPHALTANFVLWLNFHNNNTYDIAIFNPNILKPNSRGEVDINWQEVINMNNVNIITNLHV